MELGVPMQAQLIVVGGKADKAEIMLELPAVVGRSPESGLNIAHPMISRQHCEIFEVDGLVMIRDLDSLNGTLVAGRRITEVPLPPESEFTLGPLTFRVAYPYEGDLGKLPSSEFAEPDATASSVATLPETPDFQVVDEPAPVDTPSVGGGEDRDESDEFFSESAQTPEVSESVEKEADEETEEDERIDFLSALEEEETPEETDESKEPELEEVAPELPPESAVLEEFAEEPLAEVQPVETATLEESAEECEVIEELLPEVPTEVEASEAEDEIAEELNGVFHLTEGPIAEAQPAEPVAAEGLEMAFDAIEEPAAEAEAIEPTTIEEPEVEFEAAEEPEGTFDLLEEFTVVAMPAEPVAIEEQEVTFEAIEEPVDEVEPTEPVTAAEPEIEIEIAEETEGVLDLVEEPEAETTPSESEVVDEPDAALEAVEESAITEEPDVEDVGSPEETAMETAEEEAVEFSTGDQKAVDTSTAMNRLATRGRKQRQSWLGGFLERIQKKRVECAAKRKAEAAKAPSQRKDPVVESAEIEERLDDKEIFYDEQEEGLDDESAEQPDKSPDDPIHDLLKDFIR